MQTDNANWKFTAYGKGDKEIESFVIADRTEHEANNEAMHYVEAHQNIIDWTLTMQTDTKKQVTKTEIIGYPEGNIKYVTEKQLQTLMTKGLVSFDDEWTEEKTNGQYGFNNSDENTIDKLLKLPHHANR